MLNDQETAPTCLSAFDRLKATAKRHLSAQNAARLAILARSFRDLKQTFAQPASARHPIGIDEIQAVLEEFGVSHGDVLHVHSSVSHLMRGGVAPPAQAVRGQRSYSQQIIDLLIEMVGPSGTITMNTDFRRPPGWFKRLAAGRPLEDDVFDPRVATSARGVISELFRRRPDVHRSVHPYYNVTAWGRLAKELVYEHHKSTPYTQDRFSPWSKLTDAGGKVLLLGRTFDINSLVHLVEYLHPDEFPRPVFLAQPIKMPYLAHDGSSREIDVLLHSSGIPGEVFFQTATLHSFARYLNRKYPLYQVRNFADDAQIVVYDAQAHYRAFLEEMHQNVTWYDPQFLS